MECYTAFKNQRMDFDRINIFDQLLPLAVLN